MKPTPTRRDFLTGRAVGQLVSQRLHQPDAGVCALLEFTRPAMGSSFTVYMPAERDGHRWSETAVGTLDLVQYLESRLSVFQPASELSEINRAAADGPVRLQQDLFDLLAMAADLSASTNGAFDITVAPLSRLWGFLGRSPAIPSDEAVARTKEFVGGDGLRLDKQDCSIAFARAGMEINLHSIGKGYALDQCAQLLQAVGAGDYLLQGGQSSLLASGMRAREKKLAWSIELRHPLRQEQLFGAFLLRDQALATSGGVKQSLVDPTGRRLGHIVDPRTGWPPTDTLSVSVLASSAAEADALATAFFVMTYEEIQTYCDKHRHVGAVLVMEGESGDAIVQATGQLAGTWKPA